jgi:RNA-directed DNA polymerase
LDAENNKESCSQRNSPEGKKYVRAHRSFNRIWKERNSAQPDLLDRILDKDNLNRAYKRVKANKGAPGVDGMTIEEALPWLKEHNRELVNRIRSGHYTPSPVRRKEIPKPDGGMRKLGIPTVIDRIIQQAMAQQMMPVFEPLFSDGSYGYRPGRSAKDAVKRVKEYAEQGYTSAVVLDLSKYFDTMNHTLLLNLLRKQISDERVIQMVKRYLKSGVMENGVVVETTEGSPQGGNLSPLLANIYLNEFDQEFKRRGVPCVRYADDIVLLARSPRAAQRLLGSSTKFLEGTLMLRVNKRERVARSACTQSEILSTLALHSERDATEYSSAFMRSHGRRPKTSSESSLPGAAVAVLSEQWHELRCSCVAGLITTELQT